MAPPSPYKLIPAAGLLLRRITLCLAFACQAVYSQVGAAQGDVAPGSVRDTAAEHDAALETHYVVDIELQTIDDLRQLLERTNQLMLEGKLSSDEEPAVVFVLHGPVLRNLLRTNYLDNKTTVDQAASLSALGVVDMRACRTWLTGNDVDEQDLQPFIQTVSYGPAEIERLMKERNYIYF